MPPSSLDCRERMRERERFHKVCLKFHKTYLKVMFIRLWNLGRHADRPGGGFADHERLGGFWKVRSRRYLRESGSKKGDFERVVSDKVDLKKVAYNVISKKVVSRRRLLRNSFQEGGL